MEKVLRERAEEGSQETSIEVVLEEIEVVVEEGEAKAFYSKKGAETFQKYLAKKNFVEKGDSRIYCHRLKRRLRDEARKS